MLAHLKREKKSGNLVTFFSMSENILHVWQNKVQKIVLMIEMQIMMLVMLILMITMTKWTKKLKIL